jgi:DNA (cytosine-5)-methyltransferase 1
MQDIIDVDADEKLYITPVGCKGILRRKEERGLTMNLRLEEILRTISSTWTDAEIEFVSRKQARGRFSNGSNVNILKAQFEDSLPLWNEY